MTSSYDPSSANIRVKVDGVWRDADEQERAAYIAYKSRYHNHREAPHTHDNGITIFRAGRDNEIPSEKNDDPYMPTYFRKKLWFERRTRLSYRVQPGKNKSRR